MKLTPQAQTTSEGSLPPVVQDSSVILGRQDVASVLLRLTRMELYKVRRRAMSKVLGIIAIVMAVGFFLILSLGTFYVSSLPPESFQPQCQAVSPPGGQPQNCPPPMSEAQLAQAKHQALATISQPLRLPHSLFFAVLVALNPSTILIIILMGAIAGGEFSIGTARLIFTRGPTRTQFLLAKLGLAIICSATGLLTMVLLGILFGALLNLASGIPQNFDFFSAAWIGHAVLYLLVALLNWFIYAAMAISFGTLGRSTVAGITGALIWFLLEPVVGLTLSLVGAYSRGPFGDLLRAIPDYFIGNNIGALLQNQAQYVFGGSPASLSNLHALIVLVVYLAVFIGLALWINERRDVTN